MKLFRKKEARDCGGAEIGEGVSALEVSDRL